MAAVGGRPRLLALRALGLGDLLTAVPALRALAETFPEHHRLLACPAALAPLVDLIDAVDELVDVQPLAALPPWLEGVDVAVNLHGRGPQSHRLLAELQPRRLIAFGCRDAGVEGPTWRADEHEVARWCRMLDESGIPADPARLAIDAPEVELPAPLRGLTLVHPGAAAPSRRWPAERYAAVARALAERGRSVAITGSSAEVALARDVAGMAGLPAGAVLAGRTGLAELAVVVAAAAQVICGDTGMAHLATALGTPSIVLFGPTSPALWGPPRDSERHLVLWAGRRGDPHGTVVDLGLLEIDVDSVLDALDAKERGVPAYTSRTGCR